MIADVTMVATERALTEETEAIENVTEIAMTEEWSRISTPQICRPDCNDKRRCSTPRAVTAIKVAIATETSHE